MSDKNLSKWLKRKREMQRLMGKGKMQEYKGIDMKNTDNGWYRDGLFYRSQIKVFHYGKALGTITRRLDFVSYHLIRWYHGDQKLKEMAYDLERVS